MATTLAPGTVVAGRYRVESLIGEGGMGAVYLVQHVHTDEKLAMKVLHAQTLRDDTAVERFRREARAPARVHSEHVARVTDADTAPELDGAPFYVMEYLRGKDLDTILTEGGPLPPPVVVEYMRQTARALDKAHGMGIVHRDLKPENLFLTSREDGTPCIKLLDFGIAKLADQAPAPSEIQTQSGAVFGTPSFMSPEQTRGEVALVGPAADIWAFGLITFKLLAGREYWQANVVAQLYVEILQSPIVAPSTRGLDLGEAFDAWFMKCVARDIIDRFESAGEAVVALGDALGVDLPRAAAASLAWMPPFDPAATDSHKRTNVWPQAKAQPARRSPIAIIVAVLGLGVLCVAALGFGIYKAMADEAAVDAAATPRSASSDAPTPLATAPGVSDSAAVAPSADATAGDDSAVRHGSPAATGRARSSPTTASDDAPKSDRAEAPHGPTDDQRRRLESLQRLCDSGTVPAAECASKRAAILRNAN